MKGISISYIDEAQQSWNSLRKEVEVFCEIISEWTTREPTMEQVISDT